MLLAARLPAVKQVDQFVQISKSTAGVSCLPVQVARQLPSIQHLRARALILAVTRDYFVKHGYLEVETPILSRDVCVDAHLDPYQLDLELASTAQPEIRTNALSTDRRERVRYLQTSPEFAMKRLLEAGSGSIFQLARVFRADECGTLHNPEFTMLEWYRVGGDFDGIIDEVASFVRLIYQTAGAVEAPTVIGIWTYCEAFERTLGFDPLQVDLATLAAAANEFGLANCKQFARDDLLNFLMAAVVQPKMPPAVFVRDYPATQAALAKLHPDRTDLALRFELFLSGIEICNGYAELTDAKELRDRNHRQNTLRRAAGKLELPEESCLLEAMDRGLPDSAGVALGFDRLVMLALGLDDIESVIAFPWPAA